MTLTGAAWYLVIFFSASQQWQVPFAFHTLADCKYAAAHLTVVPVRTVPVPYACVPAKWSFTNG